MFWLSLGLFGCSTLMGLKSDKYNNWDIFYNVIGFISIWFLFVFISIPIKEERMLKNKRRKPKFVKYQKNVSRLLLWKSNLPKVN